MPGSRAARGVNLRMIFDQQGAGITAAKVIPTDTAKNLVPGSASEKGRRSYWGCRPAFWSRFTLEKRFAGLYAAAAIRVCVWRWQWKKWYAQGCSSTYIPSP